MNENMNYPIVICPNCQYQQKINSVLTAQSNQNVIYECPDCGYELRNIETSKG
jgi:Zn ribbon nucleic-acid-binding protein